jgi:anti-sigma regulatory factor (Ser/Thr protein kinase)
MSRPDASSALTCGDAAGVTDFAVRLPSNPSAAAAARRLRRMRFGHVVAEDTMDDVLIVVSELVANAVLHGSGEIELRVAFDGTRVTGEVADEGGGFARQPPKPVSDPIAGNGLYLVERIVSGWGVQDDSAQIWFEIPERRLC